MVLPLAARLLARSQRSSQKAPLGAGPQDALATCDTGPSRLTCLRLLPGDI